MPRVGEDELSPVLRYCRLRGRVGLLSRKGQISAWTSRRGALRSGRLLREEWRRGVYGWKEEAWELRDVKLQVYRILSGNHLPDGVLCVENDMSLATQG